MTFVLLFRGHLVKYNYILIFYNIDTMSDQIPPADNEEQKVDPLIDAKAAEETNTEETSAEETNTEETSAADPFAPTSPPPPSSR